MPQERSDYFLRQQLTNQPSDAIQLTGVTGASPENTEYRISNFYAYFITNESKISKLLPPV